MAEHTISKYEPFFGKWHIDDTVEQPIGSGSFGKVYKIYCEDSKGNRLASALKYIPVPKDDAALQKAIGEQPNPEAVRTFFWKQVKRIEDEIQILDTCRDHRNIVRYEEHFIVENPDRSEIGWDILIRMELLEPLIKKKQFGGTLNRQLDAIKTQYDAVKMWRDIANALIFCEKKRIIHRDIKIDNILQSPSGDYKLSDFGVARQVMDTDLASTYVGTMQYMSPEVYFRKGHDKRTDYYSLGCVVYYFLNRNVHIFYPKNPDASDADEAFNKRMCGDAIPPIPGVSSEINEVLLKSLAYDPKDRYGSAKDLYRAVSHILKTQGESLRQKSLIGEVPEPSQRSGSARSANLRSGSAHPEPAHSGEDPSPKKKRLNIATPVAAAGILLVLGVGGIVYGTQMKNTQRSLTANAGGKGGTAAQVLAAVAETGAGIESQTEARAEIVTEAPTEAPTEAMTEAPTEAPTEAATEPPTEAPTEPPTEPPTEAPTEAPIPTARVFGMLERPQDGDKLEGELRVKGWVLLNDTLSNADIHIDFLQSGQLVSSFVPEKKELGEKTLKKRQNKYQEQIAATQGYEIKGSHSLEELQAGTYELRLVADDAQSGLSEVLQTMEVSVSAEARANNDEIMEALGLAGEGAELDTHYLFADKGFAIGLDVEDDATSIKANAGQILLSGWVNAQPGTSLGVFVDIDGEVYTAEDIRGRGGELLVTRAPRNLEGMETEWIGSAVLDIAEAGYVVEMNLPFLEAGEHTLKLTMNLGMPEKEPELIDMKPLALEVDPSVKTKENAVEKITKKWAKDVPKTEAQTEE